MKLKQLMGEINYDLIEPKKSLLITELHQEPMKLTFEHALVSFRSVANTKHFPHLVTLCSTRHKKLETGIRRKQGLDIHFSVRWHGRYGIISWVYVQGRGGEGCGGHNSHHIKIVNIDCMPPNTMNTSNYIVLSDGGILQYHTNINNQTNLIYWFSQAHIYQIECKR